MRTKSIPYQQHHCVDDPILVDEAFDKFIRLFDSVRVMRYEDMIVVKTGWGWAKKDARRAEQLCATHIIPLSVEVTGEDCFVLKPLDI